MKTHILLIGLTLSFLVSACDSPTSPQQNNQFVSSPDLMPSAGEINSTDSPGLVFMREEEKLARDVYRFFYSKYGLEVFQNISVSEQRHMDAVKTLLDRYRIQDPVADNSPGVFANPTLSALYERLIESGSVSSTEAVKAALLIEEVDIIDLKEKFNSTSPDDVLWVSENLTRGSRNHIRGFYNYLTTQSEVYSPSLLSQEEFNSIISTPIEKGRKNRK